MKAPGSLRLPKPVSEARRQRDVFIRYGSAFRHLPHLDQLGASADTSHLPADHVPLPSDDSSLVAFAQLACLRLGACRAMISLIDDQRQHILAEATPDLLLQSTPPDEAASSLWLGSVSIPRTWGVCENLLTLDVTESEKSGIPVVVIHDLAESPAYRDRTYVRGGPKVRFYAGAALTSPQGAIVGTLCVFDDKPRGGLAERDLRHLQNLATTVIEYLDSYTIMDRYKRGEQLTRGLITFAEGDSNMQPFYDENLDTASNSCSQFSSSPSTADTLAPSPPTYNRQTSSRTSGTTTATSMYRSNPQPTRSSAPYMSVKALQESILPSNSRTMFARAAKVIQAASNLDGVLMLDASVAGIGRLRQSESPDHSSRRVSHNHATNESSDTFSSSKSSDSESSASPNAHRGFKESQSTGHGKTCQVLGIAIPNKSDFDGERTMTEYQSFQERDLTRLFHAYPKGKVLNFNAAGEVMSTDESEDSAVSATETIRPREPEKRRHDGPLLGRLDKVFRSFLPEARSIAFVPLWDYERSRWFAGCLCWTNSPDRQLSGKLDLSYFKVFGHSIMTELSRLDALAANQAKTSFVASISHEMRSPLHGILGTLEFFKDTPLNSFQLSMLNSLAACGQTLLDTINHVLDYSTSGDIKKNSSSIRLRGSNSIRLTSKPLKNRPTGGLAPQDPVLDLAIATEEVVEACFSDLTYQCLPDRDSATLDSEYVPFKMSFSDQAMKRKSRYLALDIAHEEDWNYFVSPGSWRRILMNLLANALKYTDSGHVRVSLRAAPAIENKGESRTIVLSIVDSGCGMGHSFLANAAFKPFTQENPHAVGTGLGLSIVRQIVETTGGKVDVTSDTSVGTDVVVRLSLPRPKTLTRSVRRTSFQDTIARLRGRRICILHKTHVTLSEHEDVPDHRESLVHLTDALASTLTGSLKMEVIQTTDWGHGADFVIVPEVSFDYLTEIRQRRTSDARAPVTIFVAADSIEAAALRTDARITSKESVVEIMTQPCGPLKLATILDSCFNRFESAGENVWLPEVDAPPIPPDDIKPSLDRLSSGRDGVDPLVPWPEVWEGELERAEVTSSPETTSPEATSTEATSSSEVSSTAEVSPTAEAASTAGTASIPEITSILEAASIPEVASTEEATSAAEVTYVSDTALIPESAENATPAFEPSDVMLKSAEVAIQEARPTTTPNSEPPQIVVHDFEPTVSSITGRPAMRGAYSAPQISPHDNGEVSLPRVLITDDNALNRRLLVAFLKRHNLPHHEAHHGLEALLSYQEAKDKFDVILMDISMPVMDGMTATRAIRKYEKEYGVPRAYIIALTGLASASARLEAWSSGIDQYMTKPVNFKLLERYIKDKGSRKRMGSPGNRTPRETE